MAQGFSRRHFFYGTLLAGAVPAAGFGSVPSLTRLGYKSPNEKLNIASIGAGGKAHSDLNGCASENIVALCDVDEKRAARKFKEYEKAPKYKDFRRMLDEQAKNIDAVIVTACASGRLKSVLKYVFAFVVSCELVRPFASFDSIKAVASSADCISERIALARLKSTAAPTSPITGTMASAKIGATLPRRSFQNRFINMG